MSLLGSSSDTPYTAPGENLNMQPTPSKPLVTIENVEYFTSKNPRIIIGGTLQLNGLGSWGRTLTIQLPEPTILPFHDNTHQGIETLRFEMMTCVINLINLTSSDEKSLRANIANKNYAYQLVNTAVAMCITPTLSADSLHLSDFVNIDRVVQEFQLKNLAVPYELQYLCCAMTGILKTKNILSHCYILANQLNGTYVGMSLSRTSIDGSTSQPILIPHLNIALKNYLHLSFPHDNFTIYEKLLNLRAELSRSFSSAINAPRSTLLADIGAIRRCTDTRIILEKYVPKLQRMVADAYLTYSKNE